jgi:hypothetical protein
LIRIRIGSGFSKSLDPDLESAKYLDPETAKYLDPDLESAKYLDPDPNSVNPDPKHGLALYKFLFVFNSAATHLWFQLRSCLGGKGRVSTRKRGNVNTRPEIPR